MGVVVDIYQNSSNVGAVLAIKKEREEEMKTLVLSTALVLVMGTAYAQESAPPYISGIRLEETVPSTTGEESTRSETIIVIGRHSGGQLPLAYEAQLPSAVPTLTNDDSWGENRYEYRVPLFEVSGDSHVELYSTWVEDPSDTYFGAPTHNGRSGRFVCRRPLLEVFYCLPFWD
jgi:hypothetical protein